MAGKRSVFQKHLKAGHDYAWDGRWDKAIQQYRLALDEFPQDVGAQSALAQAYVQAGRLEEALETYRIIARLSPKDPLPVQHLAELEERLGQTSAAVETYMALAEIHRNGERLRDAARAWEQAVRLAPDHLAAHQRLAAVYVRLGATDKAVEEHLLIADILQRMGQVEKALQQCREVLQLDRNNLTARAFIERLREGAEIRPAAEEQEEPEAAEVVLTPAEETQRKALSELAGRLFEEREVGPEEEPAPEGAERLSIGALTGQAIDFQTRGLTDEAISSYLKLLQLGEDRPAIHFNLGLLLQQQLRFEEAAEHFAKSVRDPEYRLGSHFALGECYRAQGQVDESLEHFLEALKIVDLQTVERDQADDLIHLYESLAESYRTKGDEAKAKGFADSLVQFLSSRGWQDQVREARARLDTAMDGVTASLAEMLEVAESEVVLKALSLSQEYLRRDLFTAASDECYRAIEYAPTYLPAHIRLADVWLQMGDLNQATQKYRLVADTYAMRGEATRAVGVYRRLLQMSPTDTETRQVCIALLKEQGEYEAALKEYIAQIEMFAKLAQVDRAMEAAEEAEELIREQGLDKRWQAAVLHQVGEIQVERVEWRAALKTYGDIKALSPSDERARVRIIDLHYKLGQAGQALAELDELTGLYQKRGEHGRVVAILRELTDLRPQTAELHTRLARAYQTMGAIPEAVEQWDTASRILWKAGQMDEAREALREIIRMAPDNVGHYRTRLQQMGG